MFEPWRTCAGAWVSAISGMDDISGNGGERGCRQGGHALRRAGCGEGEGAHDDPPRELDLEAVVARGPRLRERHGRSATPPSARRASTIVAFSMRSAAAADTTANA